jgi:ribosomal protein S18 acetylase RimI-like enzyme
MNEFLFRKATVSDIPFLVETIIEAEKSGTDILSYSTVFGLSETQTREFLSNMLIEEIDGCELSVSSFFVAENQNKVIAAISAWVEGAEGLPSSVIKGNLLNFALPKFSFEKANSLSPLLRDLHIECVENTIQLGLVYVSENFRGKNLVGLLLNEAIDFYLKNYPEIKIVYVQVFGNNIPAIKAYERVKFEVEKIKVCDKYEIRNYLPSDKKILMKRSLN